MKTEKKIFIALGILVLLGLGFVWNSKKQNSDMENRSSKKAETNFPKIALTPEDITKISKIEIHRPQKEVKDGAEGSEAQEQNVILEKKGDVWEVTSPVQAKASSSNVQSLLDNLKEIKIKEQIEQNSNQNKYYDLTDDKALHFTAYKGSDKAIELFVGKSGTRGQPIRVQGKEGVFLAAGYSSFLYARDLKNWRDTTLLKFDSENAVSVTVSNSNGKFEFSKNGDKWSQKYSKRSKDGKLTPAEAKWEKFDEAKVKSLLSAYKNLNADDFADSTKLADAGLDKPEETGGVIHIKMKDNADYIIKVGKTSKGTSRYAIKEGGDGVVVTLSSWASDWATAEAKKFEKGEEVKPSGHGDHEEDGYSPPSME